MTSNFSHVEVKILTLVWPKTQAGWVFCFLQNFPYYPSNTMAFLPLHFPASPFLLWSRFLKEIKNGSVRGLAGSKCSPGLVEQNLVLPGGRTEVKLDISATPSLPNTLSFVILTEQVNLCPFTPALNLTGWKRLQCLRVGWRNRTKYNILNI